MASTVSAPCFLEFVRSQLVRQPDSAPLVAHDVEDDPAALRLHASHGLLELRAAVTAQRMEHVAGQALRVHTNKHVVLALDVTDHQRHVRAVVHQAAKPVADELAEARGELDFGLLHHEPLGPPAIPDEVCNRDHLQAVLGREGLELRAAGHGPVVVHDLADDAGGNQSREPGEVDGRLGVTGTLEHAAGPGAEGEHVPRHRDVLGARVLGDRGGDGDRSVGGRDARRDLALGADGAVKRRPLL